MYQALLKTYVSVILFTTGFLLLAPDGLSQAIPSDSSYRTVVAGAQYATSEQHQRRWGKHYRQEWNTPVKVKVVQLDTLAGGLTAYQEGGGRQSKTLRLRDARGREYVLRSVDKTFGKALPDIAQGTFIEAIADDQVSIGHPYSAVTIPPMMEVAGIYHTNPQIIYVPKQARLGSYSEEYGDMLYLFEQRPDEDWSDAPNFGNSKKIIGTDKLLEKLYEKNSNQVDQLAFIRARLFDFLIGDWGRHEDQWRWAEAKDGKKNIYSPIPRDRDQAYTKFDGNMVTLLFGAAGFDHLQSFDKTITDITSYNFPARNLDRFMTNELSKQQWEAIARELQQKLTDAVIENAIRQMPEEVFPISGMDIIEKIKSRRDHLLEYTDQYYRFLAAYIDVPASNQRELFVVDRNTNDITNVTIFRIQENGSPETIPFYSRTFYSTETKEIRLYGLEGDDEFEIKGNTSQSILVRVVPGAGNDKVDDHSTVSHGRKMTRVYDDAAANMQTSGETKLHISSDSALNNFQYTHFEYDKKGFLIRPGITIGIGYHVQKQAWRKEPFGTEHRIMGYYGPNRGAVAFEYRYTANQLIGKWNGVAIGRADIPYVANYFGTGNETMMSEDVNRKFYRYRATAFTAGFNLNRLVDSTHYFSMTTSFKTMDIKDDADRFINKDFSGIPASSLERKYFAVAEAAYRFKKSDHPVVPTRGFAFDISAVYTQNLKVGNTSIVSYASSASVYLPFLDVFSLAIRAGGSTVTGKPEFFQLATLSGKDNLRGYRRQRFYGKTSFYNNNELRVMFNTRNKLFNGKTGLLVFVDQGRVWQPGEISDTWHIGYGAGVFVAPFNRIVLNASYGLSEEDRVIHLRIGFLF